MLTRGLLHSACLLVGFVSIMVRYGLVVFEDGRTYDVLKMSFITCHSGEEPSAGSEVNVQWRGEGDYAAKLIAVSESEQKMVRKMEKIISQQNKSRSEAEKNKEHFQKKQDSQLLEAIDDAHEGSLRKENEQLRKENAALRAELKKYRRLDDLLKTAEDMVQRLQSHCPQQPVCSGHTATAAQSHDPPQPSLPLEHGPAPPHTDRRQGQQQDAGQVGPFSRNVADESVPGPVVEAPAPVDVAGLSTAPKSQLRYSWSDTGVVELDAGSGIFLPAYSLKIIEQAAKTSTAIARGLLTAVFTEQALYSCSVKGNRAKGSHRPTEQRPPLEPAAIQAILSFTKTLGGKRTWEYSEKVTLQSIGTKLSEMRNERARQKAHGSST